MKRRLLRGAEAKAFYINATIEDYPHVDKDFANVGGVFEEDGLYVAYDLTNKVLIECFNDLEEAEKFANGVFIS